MEITLTDRALLFDLDVTLVRTGDIVVESMTAWCRLHRLDLQLVLSHSSGMRIEDTVAKVAPHLDADAECKRIEEIESGCLEKLEPVFGAVELVRKLDPNLWGIVTSSSLALAHRKIDAAGISAPKTLISSESVTNGKPHPECYMLAAKALRMKPEHCVVFEDADVGIEAGLSAGCSVIGVGEGFSPNKDILAAVPDFRCVYIEGRILSIRC